MQRLCNGCSTHKHTLTVPLFIYTPCATTSIAVQLTIGITDPSPTLEKNLVYLMCNFSFVHSNEDLDSPIAKSPACVPLATLQRRSRNSGLKKPQRRFDDIFDNYIAQHLLAYSRIRPHTLAS